MASDLKRRLAIASVCLAFIAAGLYGYRAQGFLRPAWIQDFFKTMILSKDEQLRRIWGDFYKQMQFINKVTPEDSLIIFPRPESFSDDTKLRHAKLAQCFLFPRRGVDIGVREILSHRGPVYRIVIPGFDHEEPHLGEYRLDDHFRLWLLRERAGPPAGLVRDFRRMRITIPMRMGALVKFFLIMLVGTGGVALYFSERSHLSFFTTSFLLGTALDALGYVLLSLARISLTEPVQFLYLGVLSLLSFLVLLRTGRWKDLFGQRRIFSRGGVLIVGLWFGLLFLKGLTSPIQGRDACGIWAAKAQALFAFHDLRVLGFWGANLGFNYPPLLPIVMSQMALGGEGMVNVLFPFFALCLYATLRDEIEDTKFSAFMKAVLPLAIFGSPFFFRHSLQAYANLPLAVFVTKAITVLSSALREQTRRAWLALAMILCGVVFVRPDGSFYLIVLMAVAFLASWFKGQKLTYGICFSIPLGCMFLWDLYCVFVLHVRPADLSLLRDLARRLWTGQFL